MGTTVEIEQVRGRLLSAQHAQGDTRFWHRKIEGHPYNHFSQRQYERTERAHHLILETVNSVFQESGLPKPNVLQDFSFVSLSQKKIGVVIDYSLGIESEPAWGLGVDVRFWYDPGGMVTPESIWGDDVLICVPKKMAYRERFSLEKAASLVSRPDSNIPILAQVFSEPTRDGVEGLVKLMLANPKYQTQTSS